MTEMTRWVKVALSDPREAWDRLSIKVADIFAKKVSITPLSDEPDPRWEQRLHEWLGIDWPCPETEQFGAAWDDFLDESRRGSSVEPGSGHDADIGLARTVWCLTSHLDAQTVVETGVARGLTSRFILQCLDRAGRGELLSVDLPPLSDPWRSQVGTAIPDHLKQRWTYLRGSSKRRLPGLCATRPNIDLAILDSLHTDKHIRFELETVQRSLRRGGAIVVDDIDAAPAFSEFAIANGARWTVARHESKNGLFGVALL